MTAPRRVSEATLVWLAATLGSLVFLLAGPYSNYGPAGFLDPWFYTGYFTNFSYLVRHIGPTYFVSRLPWILPGVAAFRVAPPEVASVFLNLAIVSVSAVSLYWAVRWEYGRAPAVVASVLLVANPYFMSTVGWDYPDGPAIAYAFAALALAVRPNGPAWRNSILAGALLALSGLTNMAGGPMLIAIGAILLLRQRHTGRELARECVLVGGGGVAAILAFCPISQLLFGRWTYFYWQVYQAMHTLGNHEFLAKIWGTGNQFLFSACRLFAPALLLVFAPVYLARRRKVGAVAWPAYLGLLVCLGLYAFEEFVLHGVALRVQYHSDYMVVPLFFLAGVILGERGISWGEAGAAILVALALPFGLRSMPQAAQPLLMHPWWILFVAGAAAVASFLPRRLAMAPCLVGAVLCLSPGLDQACSYVWDSPQPGQGRNVEVFRNLMNLQQALKSHLDPERRARFWWDRRETPASFYDSAESLYLWMHEDFTSDLARWPAARARETVQPNVTFVHLTLSPERLAERTQLLGSRGIRVGNERRWSMPYRGATLYVILQDVADVSGLH